MKAIGGYFSLELNECVEYHQEALRLNAGRYALEYILKSRKYTKVYLPYFICESVLQPFKQMGVGYEFYHINENLEPAIELHPKDDEAVLFVNYFGLLNRALDTLCYSYRNTILDFTQAFYSEKGNKNNDKRWQCDTFYSCRKYFGVPDGAYLYTDCHLDETLTQDESYERMTFLTKRIDRSPEEAYAYFHANDNQLATVGMRRMSKLTEAMMKSIDYIPKAQRRIQNFQILDRILRSSNRLKWELGKGVVPQVYPYFIEDGARLRQYLIDHKVFCARYWPNVLEWCKKDDLEYQLALNLVCIPIDQRYDDLDMQIVLKSLSEFK